MSAIHTPSSVRSVTGAARRAILRRDAVNRIGPKLIIAMVLSGLVIAIDRVWFGSIALWWVVPVVLGIGAVAWGIVDALRRAPDVRRSAGLLDERLTLNSRLRSAMELETSTENQGFIELAMRDADAFAGRVDTNAALPAARTEPYWYAGAALLACVAVGIWLPQASLEPPAPKPVPPTRAIAELDAADEITREIEQDEGASESVKERLSELEALKEELAQGVTDEQEADAKTAAKLEELADAMDESAQAASDESGQVSESIEAMQNRRRAEQDPLDPRLDEFADALRQQEYAEAADQIEGLNEAMESMTPEERERIAQQLEDLANAIEPDGSDPEPQPQPEPQERDAELQKELSEALREQAEQARNPQEQQEREQPESSESQSPAQNEQGQQPERPENEAQEEQQQGNQESQEQGNSERQSEEQSQNETGEPREQGGSEQQQQEQPSEQGQESGEQQSSEQSEQGEESGNQSQGNQPQENQSSEQQQPQEQGELEQQQGDRQQDQQGQGDQQAQERQSPGEGESLEEQLRRLEQQQRQSQRSRENAEELRERARRLTQPDRAEDQPQPTGARSTRDENRPPEMQRGGGDGERDPDVQPAQPGENASEFVPFDGRDQENTAGGEPVGEWYGPDGEPVEPGTNQQTAQRFRRASQEAQKALEEQQVPRRYRHLVREVFQRVQDRADDIERSGPIAPQGEDATPSKPATSGSGSDG